MSGQSSKPPQCKRQCSLCMYKDNVDTYEHTCWAGRLLVTVLISVMVVPVIVSVLYSLNILY